ncbi:2Fe-2S iron-sulfur cluster binding domain-containing protein [Actinomadura sp. J1-007]|nr:2Fe-2S iron-sulfur cluster binding domain-containing protein [Actinomadura sp. J1-007]
MDSANNSDGDVPPGGGRPPGGAPPGGPPVRAVITLVVNGTEHRIGVDTRASLLDVLREDLGLTGSKKGCDHGQCGACTILLDGRRANGCLALAVAHDGARITTVEGLADGDRLSPLQEAFIEYDAFQCGYCTPGQLCSATAVLDEAAAGWPSAVTPDITAATPMLDAAEIRERMSGNLCRCGAYVNIVAALRDTAERAERQSAADAARATSAASDARSEAIGHAQGVGRR